MDLSFREKIIKNNSSVNPYLLMEKYSSEQGIRKRSNWFRYEKKGTTLQIKSYLLSYPVMSKLVINNQTLVA